MTNNNQWQNQPEDNPFGTDGFMSGEQPNEAQTNQPPMGQQPNYTYPPMGQQPNYTYDNYDRSNLTNQNLRISGPWERLGARIIDFLILLVPSFIIVFFVIILTIGSFGGLAELTNTNSLTLLPALTASLLSAALTLGYEYYCLLHRNGSTIGKSALNIKVVKENGEKLDQETVLKRLLLAAIGSLPIGAFTPLLEIVSGGFALVVFVATAIMIFVDDRRQVPSDKIAKTIVVYK